MGITFPDNDNRKNRLLELASDTSDFLFQATEDYNEVRELTKEVNQEIGDVYASAQLEPPGTRKLDILKLAGVAVEIDTDQKILEISEVLAKLGGFVSTVKYLAPAATKLLVKSGLMAEEAAAKIFIKFTVPIVGRQITITAGDAAGTLVGGVLGGVAVGAIELGMDAIEGAVAKGKLRDGLHTIYPIRTATRVSEDKAATLLKSLRAIKTTLDALDGAGIPITDEVIQNLIRRDAQPSIDEEKVITMVSVKAKLAALDQSRNSWTKEDVN